MLQRPRWCGDIRAVMVPPDQLLLRHDQGLLTFEGDKICRLAALIDGVRSRNELVEALGPEVPAQKVFYLLLMLEKQQLIQEAGIPRLPAPYRGEISTVSHAVELDIAPGFAPDTVVAALKSRGLVMGGSNAPFRLYLCRDYLDPETADELRKRQADTRPTLPARLYGQSLWIGPLLGGPNSGCFDCLHRILLSHRFPEPLLLQEGFSVPPFPDPLPETADVAALHLLNASGHRQSGFQTIDLMTGEARKRPLIGLSGCPRCNPNHGMEPAIPRLQSRPVEPGQWRLWSKDRVLELREKCVDTVCGLIPDLTRIPIDGPGTLSFVHSYANLFTHQRSLKSWRDMTLCPSMGKGLDFEEAAAGALCEALERYSHTELGGEYRIRATYRSLGEQAVHPHDWLGFSESQYARREALNRSFSSGFHFIPRPFDPNAEISWVPLWSLTRHRTRYVPTRLALFNRSQAPYGGANSNGCAVGSCFEEAVLYGLLELVERDAVAVWWYNRLRVPELALDPADPLVIVFREALAANGRDLWVLDITHDLGIPCFTALSACADGSSVAFGFSAHLDARKALYGALMELGQTVWSLFPREIPQGPLPHGVQPMIDWLTRVTRDNQPYLKPDPTQPKRGLDHYPDPGWTDLKDAVNYGVEQLARAGLETLVADFTRAETGLAAARVAAPGMRMFWNRFGPGRLYDVPVAMGLLSEPTREEDLNPYQIFV
ncbi:MAG: TOMM precursor leader peptide-binding protein [Acidobacteriota bacterium]|nr:TOMM precursor leader peptide-binding protein [Acidobacteriota bacterium]